MLSLSQFIKSYVSMILYPINVAKGVSFQLSNNTRISFDSDFMDLEAKKKLSSHYERININV